jgi:hypothetical protein
MTYKSRGTWYVSFEQRGGKRAHIRATETFPNERKAKKFARAKLVETLNVSAGTLNPHLPKRTIAPRRMLEWLEEQDDPEAPARTILPGEPAGSELSTKLSTENPQQIHSLKKRESAWFNSNLLRTNSQALGLAARSKKKPPSCPGGFVGDRCDQRSIFGSVSINSRNALERRSFEKDFVIALAARRPQADLIAVE